MKNPKFQIFVGKDNQYYFRLRAGNGRIIVSSEGYTSKNACENGIDSVKTNALNDERYRRKMVGGGRYSFLLVAANGETIGNSQRYKSKGGREKGISAVKVTAPGAPVEWLGVEEPIKTPEKPPIAEFTFAPASGIAPLDTTFDASASHDPDGKIVRYAWNFGDGEKGEGIITNHTFTTAGAFQVTLTVEDDNGQIGSAKRNLQLDPPTQSGLPPDPETAASPIEQGVASDIANNTEFLYTGADPIQTGVVAGTIEKKRLAVLRGRVKLRTGVPLSGVTINILGRSKYGETISRTDGMFDMAVNGGGPLTICYQKEGYLPVHRSVDVPWRDFVWAPDVVMISIDDGPSTKVDLSGTDPIHVAQGKVCSDESGQRQATVLIPQGTGAEMVIPDGSRQAITDLSVRIIEYTEGESGPQAMPAALPPNSGYTYCVEYQVDEAAGQGASSVEFDRPLYHYVENFLEFPTGEAVPVGYYDRDKGTWIPSNNGLVIQIAGTDANGLAEINVNYSGTPADLTRLDELGFTDEERRKLADLYDPDTSLWRVPINHFSTVDLNWGLTEGAEAPNQKPIPQYDSDPCKTYGSIIDVQNQLLGEVIDLVGAPYSLYYNSASMPGYKAPYKIEIPLTDASLPDRLVRVELVVSVAGQRHQWHFQPVPDLKHVFTWDGKDAYGRAQYGNQPITVNIGYTYEAVYMPAGAAERSFANYNDPTRQFRVGPVPKIIKGRQHITIWQDWHDFIGRRALSTHGLGGWSLNIHHAYNPTSQTLSRGDGGSRSAQDISQVISAVAVNFNPASVAVSADGSLYTVDQFGHVVYRIDLDKDTKDQNRIIVIGKYGTAGTSPDGTRPESTLLNQPAGIAFGPDGALYIAEKKGHRIRRVDPGWAQVTTVGGTGDPGEDVDGIPAVEAKIIPSGPICVGRDGNIYFVAMEGQGLSAMTVRRINADGSLTKIAGTNRRTYSGDGGPAAQAALNEPNGIALGPDGSIYISDWGNNRIRRIGNDGIITTVAGAGKNPADGGLATEAQIGNPTDVAVGPDGSLYIFVLRGLVYYVNPMGRITLMAGGGDRSPFQESLVPVLQTELGTIAGKLALTPDGSLYIGGGNGILQASTALPGFSISQIAVPSQDGSELYQFGSTGRHLLTQDTITGRTIYEFAYDSENLLTSITDGNGNITQIERDTNIVRLIAPHGHLTQLKFNSAGYLEQIVHPDTSIMHNFSYFDQDKDGLLEKMTDPCGSIYNFLYDDEGRFIKSEYPSSGSKELITSDPRVERTNDGAIQNISLITALLQETAYKTTYKLTGEVERENRCCDGVKTVSTKHPDGTTKTIQPDGAVVIQTETSDVRWGGQVPRLKTRTVETPGGLKAEIETEQQVANPVPGDPMAFDSLTERVTVNGQSFETIFDKLNRTITSKTPMGRENRSILNDNDRVQRIEMPGVESVAFVYDGQGRLESISQGSRSIGFAYDAKGELWKITDPLGRDTQFETDNMGQITKQIMPDGREISFEYDRNGNVASVTPPGKPAHTFGYTAVDLVESYTPPSTPSVPNPETTYRYNADRQLEEIKRPDGKSVVLSYDAGRLDKIEIERGEIGLAYKPGTDQLESVITPGGGSLSYEYDGALPKATHWAGEVSGSVGHNYDNNFRVVSQTINGTNAVEYSFDEDGGLIGAGDLTLTPDPDNGRLTSTELDKVKDNLTYNALGEVEAYQATANGNPLLSIQYEHDALGRIKQLTETMDGELHTYEYSYDGADRLQKVERDGVQIARYEYDDNGNRLSYTDGSGNTITGTYDEQDRLLSYGLGEYAYTDNGELLNKNGGGQTTHYDYDELGNLLKVILPNSDEIEYLIDGQNRRIGKKVNGVLAQGFLYQDGLNPVAELDAAGNVVSRFVYASKSHVPDYMIKNGVTYRIISDHLGSVRLVVNAIDGSLVQRMDYDAFGNVLLDTNPGFQPFGFAGGLYDQHTNLVRFGVRDYDAELGRWTAKDPIGLTGGLNVYAYVNNDPINYLDTSGAFSDFEMLMIFGISLILFSIAVFIPMVVLMILPAMKIISAFKIFGAIFSVAIGILYSAFGFLVSHYHESIIECRKYIEKCKAAKPCPSNEGSRDCTPEECKGFINIFL